MYTCKLRTLALLVVVAPVKPFRSVRKKSPTPYVVTDKRLCEVCESVYMMWYELTASRSLCWNNLAGQVKQHCYKPLMMMDEVKKGETIFSANIDIRRVTILDDITGYCSHVFSGTCHRWVKVKLKVRGSSDVSFCSRLSSEMKSTLNESLWLTCSRQNAVGDVKCLLDAFFH